MKCYFLIFMAVMGIVFPALSANDGMIEGKVVWRESVNQMPREGVTIQLTTYRKGKTISAQRMKSDAKGQYRFSPLDRSSDYMYEVSTIVEDAPFMTFRKGFGNDRVLLFDDFILYPFTQDPKDLFISEILLFEFGQSNTLKINHSIVIVNKGELTFDARGPKALHIPLAKGGFQLHFLSGVTQQSLELDSDANALRLVRSIEPGPENELRLEFNYHYRFNRRSVEFVYPWNIQRDKTTVALIERNYSVDGPGLKREEPREQGGNKFYLYAGGPFPADQDLRFRIKGLPLPGDQGKWIALIGMAVIFLSAMAATFLKRRQPQEESNRRDLALKAWTELNDRVTSGKTSEEDVESARTYWKNVLIEDELSASDSSEPDDSR